LVGRPVALSRSADHGPLHSFPARRSSDLCPQGERRPAYRNLEVLSIWRALSRLRLLAAGRPTPAIFPRRRRRGKIAGVGLPAARDRKSTRLNSSHVKSSYAVFCLKKKKNK